MNPTHTYNAPESREARRSRPSDAVRTGRVAIIVMGILMAVISLWALLATQTAHRAAADRDDMKVAYDAAIAEAEETARLNVILRKDYETAAAAYDDLQERYDNVVEQRDNAIAYGSEKAARLQCIADYLEAFKATGFTNADVIPPSCEAFI